MRSFLILAVIAGLGFLYYRQKQHETPSTAPTVTATKPAAALTPAPRGEASEHNWMKRSLDRARDVTEQSRAQTKRSQDP